MSAKAFYDRAVPTKNLVTTITGIITLVLTILMTAGILTPEQNADLQTHAFSIVDAVVVIWGAVSSIVLMFKAKDE